MTDHLEKNIKDELLQELSPREMQDIESALHREYVQKPDVQAEWEKVREEILTEPADNEETEEQKPARRIHLWSFLSGVAAAAAIFILFTLFNNTKDDNSTYIFSANQNTNEVLLSDGSNQMEVVSDKQLDYNKSESSASKHNRVADEKLLSVTTPRGKDYHLTLSDGTQVWLNADSKLEFPKHFNGNQRRVKLQGEAYFEVAKNVGKPFMVETDFFNTTVLGTTFNIKAYTQKDANIVLIEGSVKVAAKGKQSVTLTPGQQLSVLNSQFSVKEVDTYPYTQWREGFFYFENQTLFEIMQELGRWYNVNIAFDDPLKMNVRLHFVAKRSQSLAEAIKNMNDLNVVNIELTSDAVIIK
jgi:ferric-dicitrate binding protein FerR (iron transport regulator)